MPSVKLLSAMAYDLKRYEEEAIADPVIQVYGELPGGAQPFGVNRVYKGAQGVYEEVLLLLDPEGLVIWEQPSRFIELRGEMFEDLFRDRIDADVKIESTDEHELVFLLGNEEIGRIPVFIDAPQSLRSHGVVDEAIETALKKGSILWLTIPQPDGTAAHRPAWYVQQGKKVFVLKGGGEQKLPHLEDCSRVTMTVKSKDIKATIAEVEADVRVVDNDSDEFDKIATMGLGTRLNLRDGEAALDRWKQTCRMVELTPRL
ncbi:MAG: hypothetical protein R3320_07940 [Nitriliruptorales bacterium]|nr:hypothetical protein [Nitriliruptorales bacterium]